MNIPSLIFMGLTFGIALAMDAFSVSLANGLNNTSMNKRKMLLIAGVFSFFQAIMPLIGWICVKTIAEVFSFFTVAIPYIALVLLCFIGGKMIFDAVGEMAEARRAVADGAPSGTPTMDNTPAAIGFGALIVQGIATSIDALSVGLEMSEHDIFAALIQVLVIAVVTFIICTLGVILGKKFGTKLAGKATIFGGIILIAIGFEIFISSFFK